MWILLSRGLSTLYFTLIPFMYDGNTNFFKFSLYFSTIPGSISIVGTSNVMFMSFMTRGKAHRNIESLILRWCRAKKCGITILLATGALGGLAVVRRLLRAIFRLLARRHALAGLPDESEALGLTCAGCLLRHV